MKIIHINCSDMPRHVVQKTPSAILAIDLYEKNPSGDQFLPKKKGRPLGDQSPKLFHPQLSWFHYRALMQVAKPKAREFYEVEAITCGWDKRTLEGQIHSFYYERMLKSQNQRVLTAYEILAGEINERHT